MSWPDISKFARADWEAEIKANWFRDTDPFPLIPPALMSSEDIVDYVRVAGMVHPFYEDRLKPASYEVRMGHRFCFWNEKGEKVLKNIHECNSVGLPHDSVTFVGIDCKIRLPHYMVIRFNLAIKHVHRGLLLGTGPLVDPGFGGHLLIPLHNLTARPYEIPVNDGLIWVEFTKTSHRTIACRESLERLGGG